MVRTSISLTLNIVLLLSSLGKKPHRSNMSFIVKLENTDHVFIFSHPLTPIPLITTILCSLALHIPNKLLCSEKKKKP